MTQPLLYVRNLKTYFFTREGVVRAVDGVSFQVMPGEVLGLVGESGCGKSVTSLSILRLIDPPGRIVEGEIWFEGVNLLSLSEAEMAHIRGDRISMIFQQPKSSLNPVYPIGDQIAEVFQIHRGMKRKEAWQRAVELLRLVGIPDPAQKAHAYPHELSGGQAQRIMIAMALALRPRLLIADEPTTALDVTIQAQILDLLLDLRARFDTAIILISHDLGVIAETADRVAVMYAGQIVEQAPVRELFAQPRHPYTRGLMASVPVLGRRRRRLETIPGTVPDLIAPPRGCRFAPRCSARLEAGLTRCTEEDPPFFQFGQTHSARCWLYETEAHTMALQEGS